VSVGVVIFVIALNCIIIFILYRLQQQSLEKRMKHLKSEIQDLEDLVAAIIEEFQEIAEVTEVRATEIKNTILESASVIESDQPIIKEPIADFYEKSNKAPIEEISSNMQELQTMRYGVPNDSSASEPKIELIQALPTKNTRSVNDLKHQRILDLWEQGLSIEEIAKNLSTGRGEVQLILGIYRRS
jgi:hypothetical protein